MEKIFPEEIIGEIKENNDIVDVISQYVEVKSSGSSYKSLCPFHSEKTPSFMINREKQIYKCFGCGEGGDIINFIMKIENLDFTESIKILAERANIEINNTIYSEEVNKDIEEKRLYYEINKKAGLYFYNNLIKKPNPGLQYLLNRGLTRKTLTTFGIGYSIESWDDLIKHLQGQGYKLEDIKKCGLIRENKNGGYYDYFRNRIIFPIFNARGDVVGFGGRIMDDSHPKYLNSPETKVFIKSNILYGLNFARKHIKKRQIILVEGYMDLIILYQADFKNVVASLGTSLTKQHGQLLKKYCDEVILCFDGDTAGIKATMRSIEILEDVGCKFKIMVLPDGNDPDDYIRKHGPNRFKEQIDKSMGLIDYEIFLAKNKYSGNTMDDKIKLAKRISVIIRKIKSPIEKEAYIQKTSKETGVSEEAIKNEIYGQSRITYKNNSNAKYESNYKKNNKYIELVPLVEQRGHIIAEKQLIKFMILDSKLIPYILKSISENDFSVGNHQDIVEYLSKNPDVQDVNLVTDNIPIHLKDIIERIMQTDIQHIDLNNTLEKYVVNLRKYKLLYNIKKLEEEQVEIMNKSNLTQEEVESKLLNIGMKIMEKNLEIQKLKA